MKTFSAAAVMLAATCSTQALADTCDQLPNYATLQTHLRAVVPSSGTPSGGLGFPMWLTLVDGVGRVCAVTNSLPNSGDASSDIWLGSRVISAQKANTANSFSIGSLALSTANLYSAVQPGGSLYGLQHSNPVDTNAAYSGNAASYGLPNDPMVGKRIGGINVFGGGLPLYNARKELVGAIGVSGDTSCADHNIAWRTRRRLGLDWVPAGVSANGDDNVNYRGIVAEPSMQSDFSHPICKIAGQDGVSEISAGLPPTRK